MRTTRKKRAHSSCTRFCVPSQLKTALTRFCRGQFTDDIGEDFLGLRELGIAAEFGLSSLSVPKRLLKGKKNAKQNATYGYFLPHSLPSTTNPLGDSAKSAEPPPPYPPPPSFVPLTAESLKNQIGLLRDYYERRLASPNPPSGGVVILTDDPPNPIQTKLGPLGQVMRPTSAAIAAAASGSKKKSKATTVAMVHQHQPATPVLSPRLPPPMPPPPLVVSASVVLAAPPVPMPTIAVPVTTEQQQLTTPKKKAGTTPVPNGAPGSAGAGGGGGGKKRGRPPEGSLPPIVVASA
jgi:transcriptional activator SPT7